MNAKTCKMLRHAAGYHPTRTPAAYHQPAIHHLAEVPTYEQHTRVIRTMTPSHLRRQPYFLAKGTGGVVTDIENSRWFGAPLVPKPISGSDGMVTSTEITKTRYTTNGQRPAQQIMDAKGKPVTTLIPIAKPYRLFSGAVATKGAEAREPTARHVYHTLKRLERMKGLDNVYQEMHDAALASQPLQEAA